MKKLTTSQVENVTTSLNKLKNLIAVKNDFHHLIKNAVARDEIVERLGIHVEVKVCMNADLYDLDMINLPFFYMVRQSSKQVSLYDYLQYSFQNQVQGYKIDYKLGYFIRNDMDYTHEWMPPYGNHFWFNPERWLFVEHAIKILEKVLEDKSIDELQPMDGFK